MRKITLETWNLYLLLYCMHTCSQGSGKTAQMRSLARALALDKKAHVPANSVWFVGEKAFLFDCVRTYAKVLTLQKIWNGPLCISRGSQVII